MSTIDNTYRTNYNGSDFAAAAADKNGVKMDDFLKLFATQLQNQDFMNPMDNTQFLTQTAQFQSMQAMQMLADNMNNSLAIGLLGKCVVCADYDSSGKLIVTEAPVEKVSLVGGEIKLFLKGIENKSFTYDKLMEVKNEATLNKPDTEEKPEEVKPGEDTDTDTDNSESDENIEKPVNPETL